MLQEKLKKIPYGEYSVNNFIVALELLLMGHEWSCPNTHEQDTAYVLVRNWAFNRDIKIFIIYLGGDKELGLDSILEDADINYIMKFLDKLEANVSTPI